MDTGRYSSLRDTAVSKQAVLYIKQAYGVIMPKQAIREIMKEYHVDERRAEAIYEGHKANLAKQKRRRRLKNAARKIEKRR